MSVSTVREKMAMVLKRRRELLDVYVSSKLVLCVLGKRRRDVYTRPVCICRCRDRSDIRGKECELS